MKRDWKPPTHRLDLDLYTQNWPPGTINGVLERVIALTKAKPFRWSKRQIRHCREDAHDGCVQDLIYRTTEFCIRCKELGEDLTKVYVATFCLWQVGVIEDEEERDAILKDIAPFITKN